MFHVKHYTNLYEYFRYNAFYFSPKYSYKPRQFKNDCAEIEPIYTYRIYM